METKGGSAGVKRSRRKTAKVARSAGAPDAIPELERGRDEKSIEISVVGDIFREAFIWPQTDSNSDANALAYTAPDEIREAQPTATFTELSGVPHHAQIFDCFLRGAGFSHTEYTVECVPTSEQIDSLAPDLLSGPFPIYLHELGPFPTTIMHKKRPDLVWRIARSFGELRQADPILQENSPPKIFEPLKQVTELVGNWLPEYLNRDSNRVLVINDRNALKEGLSWTSVRRVFADVLKGKSSVNISAPEKMLIIWHTRAPLFERDSIFSFLRDQQLLGHVIPIVHFNCLRDVGVPLRFDVSFETTLRTLLDAEEHPAMRSLALFPHALIRFDYGVLHVSSVDSRFVCADIHSVNAGPYAANPSRMGIMPGRTPILVSCMLRELLAYSVANNDSSNETFVEDFLRDCQAEHPTISHSTPLDRGIDYGLLCGSRHFYNGFGSYFPASKPEYFTENSSSEHYKRIASTVADAALNFKPPKDSEPDYSVRLDGRNEFVFRREALTRLSIPNELIGVDESAKSKRQQFSRAELLMHDSVLKEVEQSRGLESANSGDRLRNTIRDIVTCGLDRVLTFNLGTPREIREPSIFCPFVSVGDSVSIESHEIDSLLSLRFLVDKYALQSNWNEPLSIAVFGKPGTGKSRFVRQALSSIPGCMLQADLEFNVSQAEEPSELLRHFHRVQDRTHDGAIPVVFFDEFDCLRDGEEVGWLRHFLMPMQDGLFRDGSESYRVGKSVFVFAGGTCDSFLAFRKRYSKNTTAKVTDFISRLRGFFDVQDLAYSRRKASKKFNPTVENRSTQIRRAVVLRSLLRKCMPQIFDNGTDIAKVDNSIIDAFLYVQDFVHGVRSMEAIIQMSRVRPSAKSFHPSALPPLDQLNMHVDASEFTRIANSH